LKHYRHISVQAFRCCISGEPRPARRTAPAVLHRRGERSEEVEAMIMVGKPAPDFSAPAYLKGRFTHVTLSEHRGKWILLFFYGGDYTFV
jgi:hypothetical protein